MIFSSIFLSLTDHPQLRSVVRPLVDGGLAQEASRSSMAAALSVTVEELAEHEERASTGDQPPSAVHDVQRARRLVVDAQVNTLVTSSSSEEEASKRRRRRRSVDDGYMSMSTRLYRSGGDDLMVHRRKYPFIHGLFLSRLQL